jgi:hypothetical protein
MFRDDFIETVGICPVVESTIPAPGAGVSLIRKFQLLLMRKWIQTFIVPAATSFTVETGGTTINGVVTYSVLLPFTQALYFSLYYRIYSKNQNTAKDLAGNALQTNMYGNSQLV